MPRERLVIYGLLNDAVRSLDCTASNEGMFNEYDFERMQRETVVACYEALLPGVTGGVTKTSEGMNDFRSKI
jgi:hypothetical protein